LLRQLTCGGAAHEHHARVHADAVHALTLQRAHVASYLEQIVTPEVIVAQHQRQLVEAHLSWWYPNVRCRLSSCNQPSSLHELAAWKRHGVAVMPDDE
jgi:hypothetical protein